MRERIRDQERYKFLLAGLREKEMGFLWVFVLSILFVVHSLDRSSPPLESQQWLSGVPFSSFDEKTRHDGDGVSENLISSNFTYGVEESYESVTMHTRTPSIAFSRRWR